MKIQKVFVLSLAAGVLAASICAWPATAEPSRIQPSAARTAPNAISTVNGKITAASDSSISLAIQQGNDVSTQQFVINAGTKIDGTPAVGAMATVDYRIFDGDQIAMHIAVQSGN